MTLALAVERDVKQQINKINLAIPINYCMIVGSQSWFKPTKQWLEKNYHQVNSYGVLNYKGARTCVPSTLNVTAWRQLVTDYDYKILAEYLEFGFSMNIDYKKFMPNTQIVNQKSAISRLDGVSKYFQVKTKNQAILGPFDQQPFKTMLFYGS